MALLYSLRRRAHDIRMLGPSAMLAFVVLWGGLITWLSAQPSRQGDASGFAAHLLFNSGHAPLFGFWAGGVAFFLASRVKHPIPDAIFGVLAVALTVAFGAIDEWHQSYVPGRTSSWTDVVTDVVGAVVTIACLRYLASAKATPLGFAVRAIVGISIILAIALGVTEADHFGV
jgi:hypothetical protein